MTYENLIKIKFNMHLVDCLIRYQLGEK